MSAARGRAVASGATGASLGLLCGAAIAEALSALPGFGVAWSLGTLALLAAGGAATFVRHGARFALVIAAPDAERGAQGGDAPGGAAGGGQGDAGGGRAASVGTPAAAARAKAFDSSALIDARVVEIAAAGFLEGTPLVPAFVLSELQRLADGGDPLRRARGRRGLEVAERLARERGAVVVAGEASDVDAGLVALCEARGADLVTTDANLAHVAAARGVRVLNPNALAQAIRPPHLPGEELRIALVRAGREPGQGLGFLDDGTMVVVEGGAASIGRQVGVVVTSSLQTQAGRMLFARPRRVDGGGS